MTAKDAAPAAPPVPRNAEGAERRVGVELEFGGIGAVEAAEALARAVGGGIERRSAHEYVVESPTLGRFRVELDTRWAHPDFVARHLEDLPEDWRQGLDVQIADLVGQLASTVMPVEIVAPPVPWPALGFLADVNAALAAAGARGTAHSAFAGFGMHFNVEVVSLAPDDLLATLRAYVVLAAWLRRESRLATIRQLQSYVDPLSNAYARFVLRPGYAPDATTLIRDHVAFNPGRDYELDMLPVFAAIDADLVARLLPKVKNAARPAYHWRLPDCRVDEPGWDPLEDWARWVEVERLAADRDLLAREARAFLEGGPQSELEARLARIRDALS